MIERKSCRKSHSQLHWFWIVMDSDENAVLGHLSSSFEISLNAVVDSNAGSASAWPMNETV